MKLMKNIKNKVQFVVRPALEFAITCRLYTYRKEDIKVLKENNIKADKRILEILDFFDDNLTPFLKKEIDFFKKTGSLVVSLFGFINDFQEIYSIEDYFKYFDKSTDDELFNYIGGSFLAQYLKDDNKGWNNVKDSISSMREYIVNVDGIKKNLKKDVLALFDSPQETKTRLRYVLNALYNIYKNFQDEINNNVLEITERFKNEFNEDSEKFWKANIFDGIVSLEKDNIKINCSYMFVFGLDFNINSNNDVVIVIGENSKEFIKTKKSNYSLDKFLKLISDKTRQKILRLLSYEDRYTQSLAKELSLTPATVNYHLQNFLLIGLLTVREEDNKMYYKLDKAMANRYIEDLKERLNLS